MVDKELVYNIPLRKEFRKVARYNRARKAITAIREFIIRHTKIQDVKLGPYLNSKVLERGCRHPPHHVKVKVVKEDKIVKAELVGAPDDFLKKKEGEKKKGVEKKPLEKKEETKEEKHIKEEDEEKKEILEKGIEKEVKEEKELAEKEEKNVKIARSEIISKTEKPKHEGRK